MNTTITFDTYDISNASVYIPESTTHDSSYQRSINAYKIARRHGTKLVSSWYDKKVITIVGAFQAISQADFEMQRDIFLEKISHQEKNLDISYAGGTRRYVATAISHQIPREPDNRDWCHFSIDFLVSEISKSTAITTDSHAGITTTPYSDTIDITGSIDAEPIITITINAENTLTAIRFTNNTSSEWIECTEAFNATDILIIDIPNHQCTLNGNQIDYTGLFPTFPIGLNSYTIVATSVSRNYDLSIAFQARYL